MFSYRKLRVPAKKVRWSDEHPHHKPCEHSVENKVSLLHPRDGKLEDVEFHRRYPGLWHQVIDEVKEISKLSYWRSWVNPKTRSCMQVYIKQRVPAKRIRWNDAYPNKQPCKDCTERSVQCIVLGQELDELIVLPRAEKVD
ncbi:hypothetical protein IWZ01DRAFT_480282 [Phyllosticta capitalensis]